MLGLLDIYSFGLAISVLLFSTLFVFQTLTISLQITQNLCSTHGLRRGNVLALDARPSVVQVQPQISVVCKDSSGEHLPVSLSCSFQEDPLWEAFAACLFPIY